MNFHCSNLSSRFNRQAQLKSDPSQYTTQLNSTTRKYCSTKCYFKVILWRDLKINCFHLYSNIHIWLNNIVNGDSCLPLKKSWWNTTFWSFPQKISGIHGISEKVVLFFHTECWKRKFVFHFFNKAIFDTCFRLSRPFFGKWSCKCTNGKRDSRTKVTSLKFCLPFTQTVHRPVCPGKS